MYKIQKRQTHESSVPSCAIHSRFTLRRYLINTVEQLSERELQGQGDPTGS